MSIKHQFIIILLLFISVFFLFEYTNLDIYVQDFFYNAQTNQWLLTNTKNSWADLIFYRGIKFVIILFGLSILFLYLYSFKSSATIVKSYRKGLCIVWVSLIVVPLVIGILKATTNVQCPCHIKHYGGMYPYIKVLHSIPIEIIKKFKCFPAGHASGGFALMSLFFLFKTKRNKILALILALLLGWSMGVYKMLIGDHYLSHTIITMLLSWLIILLLYELFTKKSLCFFSE